LERNSIESSAGKGSGRGFIELAERAEDEEGVALHDRHRRRRRAHLEALEDDAEHLRERRVGGGLDDATLADEVNVEASLHGEQQRRVMHGEGGGGDRRQHGLDYLQLHRLVLLVLAAADSVHHDVNEPFLDVADHHDLAAHVAVRDQLLDAVQSHLHDSSNL